jgi:hypothetical protein
MFAHVLLRRVSLAALLVPLAPARAGVPAPDLIIGDIVGVLKTGTIGGVTGYAFGQAHCNVGEAPLLYTQNTANHPILTPNLYRLRNGRFEQIGVGWVWHTFCALQTSLCTTCTPACTSCCDRLGAGCASSDSASAMSGQWLLGMRSEVNAFSGAFAYPFATQGQTGDGLFKRLQVRNVDLDPALNAGALYFVEMVGVARDDAAAGNHANNASVRPVLVGEMSGGGYNLALSGSTTREQAALEAWAAQDASVTVVAAPVPGEGLFLLAHRVSANGDGTWNYEYAVQNINSHRAGRSLRVPAGAGVNVTNIGFHDIDYHSGEPWSSADWPGLRDAGAVSWATQTHDENPNANALRWGTVYNFRFDANVPPTAGSVSLGLFRPGAPETIAIAAAVPAAPAIAPGDLNCDGVVNNFDIDAFVLALSDPPAYESTYPNCDRQAADINADGSVDNFDIDPFVALISGG